MNVRRQDCNTIEKIECSVRNKTRKHKAQPLQFLGLVIYSLPASSQGEGEVGFEQGGMLKSNQQA